MNYMIWAEKLIRELYKAEEDSRLVARYDSEGDVYVKGMIGNIEGFRIGVHEMFGTESIETHFFINWSNEKGDFVAYEGVNEINRAIFLIGQITSQVKNC